MKNPVSVEVKDDKIITASPYHPDFPKKARSLGGDWSRPDETWTFDVRDEKRVRKLLKETYGYDGSETKETDLVTVRYTVTQDDENPLWIAGREVANRFGRDSQVSLGENVIVIDGEFSSSAGSRRNPRLIDSYDARAGVKVTLEIRDLPRSLAEKEKLDVEIVDEEAWDYLEVTLTGPRLKFLNELKEILGLENEEVVGAALSHYALHVRRRMEQGE